MRYSIPERIAERDVYKEYIAESAKVPFQRRFVVNFDIIWKQPLENCIKLWYNVCENLCGEVILL